MKNILIATLCIFATGFVSATQYYSRSDNTWSNTDGGANCGCSPGSGGFLNNGDNVFVNHTINSAQFSMLTGSSITINNGGNWTINGSVTVNSGTITINSGGTLFINGSGSIFDSDADVTLNGTLNFAGSATNQVSIVGHGDLIFGGTFDNQGSGNINGSTADPASSPFDIGTLPVDFIYFTVNHSGKHAVLNWATSFEKNSSHFDITKSTDGINFNTIGKVKAAGFSSSVIEYAFKDLEIQNGVVYYQLVEYDFDGQIQYSKVIQTSKNHQKVIAEIYPNPFNDYIEVKLNKIDFNSEFSLDIFDIQGTIIKTISSLSFDGGNYVRIPLEEISEGLYLVKLYNGTTTEQTFKIVKK